MPLSRALSVPLICVALLAGCAATPSRQPATEAEAQCYEVFRRVDSAVAAAGVADGMAARVEGFPYLRASRFLASYAREELDNARFADWMNRMIALGSQSHAIEIANLTTDQAEVLGHALWDISLGYAWVSPALADCASRLAAADYADPERRAALRAAVRVPDDYVTWHRVAGLYWFTRIPFANGINRWHQEVRGTFALPLDALPLAGALNSYVPPHGAVTREELAALLARASANPLGIPDPRGADLSLLFKSFAPGFIVDTAAESDRPGDLGWGEGAVPQVVSRRPVVYQRISHTRYQGRVLLQLNYSIWFPERPKASGWDILGGHLDGLLWRVTLAPDGEAWLFDSIHLCGCYHMFFPTARAAAKEQPDTMDERVLAAQKLPRVRPGEKITLRLAAGTHYIERAIVNAVPAETALEYVLVDDDALRSVARPGGGRRSVFRPDGVVPGSERGERWLFWPMGVPEPGAMRQWGRHATAFVGRRHFDDADLLERYFTLKD